MRSLLTELQPMACTNTNMFCEKGVHSCLVEHVDFWYLNEYLLEEPNLDGEWMSVTKNPWNGNGTRVSLVLSGVAQICCG